MNLISVEDISISMINIIFFYANRYKNNIKVTTDIENKIIGLLFFEPSTRTNYSFQSAIYKTNGKFISYNHDFSSSKKGESDLDTVITMSQYCDLLIIRHPDNDFIYKCSYNNYIETPIVNAGNGSVGHPTQALIDFYTIQENIDFEKDKLHFSFVGDLKYGRAFMSTVLLIDTMCKKNKIIFHFVCNKNTKVNKYLLTKLIHPYQIHHTIESIIEYSDLIYMTRIQKERIHEPKNIIPLQLTQELLNRSKKNLCVLHPFPRNEELPEELDNDSKCKYFEQSKNGLYIRMALLNYIFNERNDDFVFDLI